MFVLAFTDEHGKVVGTRCGRCSRVALYVDGKIPDEIWNQECPQENRAAAVEFIQEC